MSITVNIGCGCTPTPGWLNFDNSMVVRICRLPLLVRLLKGMTLLTAASIAHANVARSGVKWADATRHIPLADASVAVLYSSHMLEHLDPRGAKRFLAEAYRILLPGGTLRLAVPDLRRRVNRYLGTGDADEFWASLNCVSRRARSWRERLLVVLGRDQGHLWMYDSASLIRLLSANGFEDATEVRPGFTTIGEPGALDLREREDESIYVEARKP